MIGRELQAALWLRAIEGQIERQDNDDSRYSRYTVLVASLAQELKMSRPFALSEEETALAIIRTADVLERSQISEGLIAHDPDITRLLDRMEAQHWIIRKRSVTDRRMILVAITVTGIELVENGQTADNALSSPAVC